MDTLISYVRATKRLFGSVLPKPTTRGMNPLAPARATMPTNAAQHCEDPTQEFTRVATEATAMSRTDIRRDRRAVQLVQGVLRPTLRTRAPRRCSSRTGGLLKFSLVLIAALSCQSVAAQAPAGPTRSPTDDAPPNAPAPNAVALQLTIQGVAVDAEVLRQQLARELQRPVVLGPVGGVSPSSFPRLTIEGTASGSVVLHFRDGHGQERVRLVEAMNRTDQAQTPQGDPQQLVLLASNLIRDEAADILAQLHQEVNAQGVVIESDIRVRVANADEAPPVESVNPSTPEEAPPQDEGAQEPSEGEEQVLVPQESPLEPPGETPSPGEAPQALWSPQTTTAPPTEASPLTPTFVGVDFLPYIGSSSRYRGQDQRHLSFGIVAAYAGATHGLSLSTAADLTWEMRGLQLASAGVLSRSLLGLQLTGGLAVSGTVEGAQIAGGATLALDSVVGAQLTGGLALAIGGVRGLQIGAGASIALQRVHGAQFSGGLNLTETLRGAQFAPLNIATGNVRGAQIGVANYADSVTGLQLSTLNISRGEVRGLQIGLVNVNENADAALGLLNIYRRGRTQLRVGAESTGLLDVSLIHGGRITHSIYSTGYNPVRNVFAVGLGFGLRARFGERIHLDFDALCRSLITTDGGASSNSARFALLSEARVVLGAKIFGVLGAYVGLAYQVQVDLNERDPVISYSQPRLSTTFSDDAFSPTVQGWPALIAGVQLF